MAEKLFFVAERPRRVALLAVTLRPVARPILGRFQLLRPRCLLLRQFLRLLRPQIGVAQGEVRHVLEVRQERTLAREPMERRRRSHPVGEKGAEQLLQPLAQPLLLQVQPGDIPQVPQQLLRHPAGGLRLQFLFRLAPTAAGGWPAAGETAPPASPSARALPTLAAAARRRPPCRVRIAFPRGRADGRRAGSGRGALPISPCPRPPAPGCAPGGGRRSRCKYGWENAGRAVPASNAPGTGWRTGPAAAAR